MRRAAVIATVVAGLAVGLLGWRSGRSTPPGARSRTCADLSRAFRVQGRATEAEIAQAAVQARRAARATTALGGFAAAVARLAVPPAPGVGAVGRPSDLALIGSTCGGAVVPAGSAIVTRAAYLTDVTTRTALVDFATDRPRRGAVVAYGPSGSDCARSHATAARAPIAVHVGRRTDYLVAVELVHLAPGTRYCYRLGGTVFDLSTRELAPTFATAAAPGDTRPFSFAVLGDWGGGTTHEAGVLARVASSPASFLVTVGDNAYIGGTQTDYGDLRGGNVFGPVWWPRVGSRMAAFVAQGNHGFSIDVPLLQNWPEPRTVAASGGSYQRTQYCCTPTLSRARHYADAWYAFDWGAARFYVLEAAWADHTGDYLGDDLGHWSGPTGGCAACGAERRWLEADLAAHRSATVKFAFFHYPLHSDASDHRSDSFLDGPDGLEGLLARNGVDIVFNGHAHLYERNLPQIPGSPMVSYVTGGGGVDYRTDHLAAVRACSAFDAYAIGTRHTSCHAPAPSSDRHVYHYLLVTVAGRQVTVTPTDETGRTFDAQTYRF